MKASLAICILAFCLMRQSIAAETLEPCEAAPDEYFSALDSRIDSGMVGRIVGSLTAIPPWGPEWGVRILERQGTYAVRITTLKRPLVYAPSQDRATIPALIGEFSLPQELAERIEAAMSREIAKAHPSDQLPFPDNPIFRLSTDGKTCGNVIWQSTQSIPGKIVQVFMELKCAPGLPHRKYRELYEKVGRLLTEIERGES
jgi:hypothetical protein